MLKTAGSSKKYLPQGYAELATYPLGNPILLAVDNTSWRYLRQLQALCLLCDQPALTYDLRFCFDREIWILYTFASHQAKAIRLGQAVQQSGAMHIVLIRLLS